MPHAKNVKKAVEEFAAAVANDDREAALEALATAQLECCHQVKAKKGKVSAATAAASTAADADVVAACDSATSTVQTVARSAQPGVVAAAGDWWDRFLSVAPMLLEIIKRFFTGSGTSPTTAP